jgi:predicted dehydrogenase/threonine dehydrogenase-like Zn-dependent dehydrogenase|tara:strand:+ start:10541 stop:13165 length:2625 start_codon:yes stop_codon:yes gene_type:complete
MRQILINSNGAVIARMPRSAVARGEVLVRTKYSLVSAGTEIASLVSDDEALASPDAPRPKARLDLAVRYLGKAAKNPKRAIQRIKEIAAGRLGGKVLAEPVSMAGLSWHKKAPRQQQVSDGVLHIFTDSSPSLYQAMTDDFSIPKGHAVALKLRGEVEAGSVRIGILAENAGQVEKGWIDAMTFETGPFDEYVVFDTVGASDVALVIANTGSGTENRLRLEDVRVSLIPPAEDGSLHNEMSQQGWNVGYSLAGEVISVGEGVTDIVPGDHVACAGAGQANHAEFVSVKSNLACKVPKGCDIRWAATTTVGAIALQGVRRAAPQLGETIAVLGLGLIGQITALLLKASGCTTLGMDLDKDRVARAVSSGMEVGSANPGVFARLVLDHTGGRGADCTIIVAATKSSEVTNLALEITRPKGKIVLVGDVGLDLDRAPFYRKELDLLMSTSYGPGRYDRAYEHDGIDYPFSHVRWSAKRNMRSYMELIALGRVDVGPLIDRIVAIAYAPHVYKELAKSTGKKPLGVLIHYPKEEGAGAVPRDETAITLRGHRKPVSGHINYALVGVGAFGVSLLVPQMEKCKGRFFLKAVVSRDTTRGGNFARSQRIEVLATELRPVLENPDIHLTIIATRHDRHAAEVTASLKAGKHVFVEKPLALTWEELDTVAKTYENLDAPPLLMVGFNRRFSAAIRKLKEAIADRTSPLIINYRLNGGYIPPDNWIQGPEGGGRNIGEACHMYNIFRFLVGCPVRSIEATSIDPDGTAYLRNDNFCACMSYEDGSIGNLVYTALGPKDGLSKERIEVFVDGQAYVIDDYKSLLRIGDAEPLWESDIPDKGHFEELKRFGDAIAGGGLSPIPFDEIVETTATALYIEDRLMGKK